MTIAVSPAQDSTTSSTANRRGRGSSCHSDGIAARPDLRGTKPHLEPPFPATASRPGTPPPGDWSSRRTRSRRRCRCFLVPFLTCYQHLAPLAHSTWTDEGQCSLTLLISCSLTLKSSCHAVKD